MPPRYSGDWGEWGSRNERSSRYSGDWGEWGSRRQKGPSELEAFLSGAADAATFGFGDELLGAARGGFDADARRRYTNEARMQQADARSAHGGWYLGGQLGGGLAGGLGVGGAARAGLTAAGALGKAANVARGIGLGGRLAAGSAAGALGGAAYGVGSANGQDAGKHALEGAMWGAAFGGIGQGLGEGVSRVAGGIRRATSPERRVQEVLGKHMERFGQTPQALDDALEAATAPGAPQGAMVMDVLEGAPQVVKGAAVRPSRERDAFRKALDDRNNGIAEETAEDLWQTLGKGLPKDAGRRVEDLEQVQKGLAAPLYAEVDKGVVQAVPLKAREFLAFHDRPGATFQSAIERTRESMRASLGVNADDATMMTQPKFWRRLLENVEAEVTASFKAAKMNPLGAPRGSQIADMTKASRELNNDIRNMLGEKFRKAQDIYAGAARAMDAEEFGKDMVRAKGDLDLTAVQRRLKGMTKAEREHATMGALSQLDEMLRAADTGSGRANPLRAIVGNASKRRMLNRLFGAEDGFEGVVKRIEQRQAMFANSVESGVGVNSHTADRLAAQASFESQTSPSVGSIRNQLMRILTGDITDAYNERASNEMVRIMRMPATQLKEEIARAGGFQKWVKSPKRDALGKAFRAQEEIATRRPKRLGEALTTGLYAPTVGETASDVYL